MLWLGRMRGTVSSVKHFHWSSRSHISKHSDRGTETFLHFISDHSSPFCTDRVREELSVSYWLSLRFLMEIFSMPCSGALLVMYSPQVMLATINWERNLYKHFSCFFNHVERQKSLVAGRDCSWSWKKHFFLPFFQTNSTSKSQYWFLWVSGFKMTWAFWFLVWWALKNNDIFLLI